MAKSVAQIAAPRGVVVDREERSPIVVPFGLKLTIHDRTRIEWIATAPIAHEGKPNQYTIDFEIDVPDHLWRRHKLWQSFRARSRLQSPDSRTYPFQMRSILDEIRHEALRTSRAFSRLERRLFRDQGEDDAIKGHLRGLLREITNSRATLRRAADEADEAIETEALLADEYISVMYLKTLSKLHEVFSDHKRAYRRLRKMVQAERSYRSEHGWPTPQGRERRQLGRWLRRSAALKRHFHQLLWLDAHPYRPEDKLNNWIAAFVAIIASTWAFAWHIAYMNQLVSGGMSAVSMLLAGALAGVLYAVKDRIKDIGRRWITSRVREGIADKIVHLHLQQRVDERRGRLMTSREQIRASRVRRPDPLNPALGATHDVVALSVSMRIDQRDSGVPSNWGVAGVKHVMRYDLSPLFSRIAQGMRSVPIAEDDGEFRSELVRKRYELPVRCSLTPIGGGEPIVRSGMLLIDRRGLRELKRD